MKSLQKFNESEFKRPLYIYSMQITERHSSSRLKVCLPTVEYDRETKIGKSPLKENCNLKTRPDIKILKLNNALLSPLPSTPRKLTPRIFQKPKSSKLLSSKENEERCSFFHLNMPAPQKPKIKVEETKEKFQVKSSRKIKSKSPLFSLFH